MEFYRPPLPPVIKCPKKPVSLVEVGTGRWGEGGGNSRMLREWGKVRPFVHIQNARVGFPFSLSIGYRAEARCVHTTMTKPVSVGVQQCYRLQTARARMRFLQTMGHPPCLPSVQQQQQQNKKRQSMVVSLLGEKDPFIHRKVSR